MILNELYWFLLIFSVFDGLGLIFVDSVRFCVCGCATLAIFLFCLENERTLTEGAPLTEFIENKKTRVPSPEFSIFLTSGLGVAHDHAE